MALMVEERIKEVATEVCQALGVLLYDVEYHGNLLRVYIDSLDPHEPVSVSLCERVSETLSLRLDILDLIPHQYVLEVSSPGIERRLRTPEHFKKAVGRNVQVVFWQEGKTKAEVGKLLAADDEGIVFARFAHARGNAGNKGEVLALKYPQIKCANVKVSDEELFGRFAPARDGERRRGE